MKKAYFAGGCFWCITPMFRIQDGVENVVSGYSGGDEENPTYQDVKGQKTGHRETIMVEYDPAAADFGTLMDVFLANVDPFDGGGQFIDRGFSYTLAVYYADDEQKRIAEEKLSELFLSAGRNVAVAVEPFKSFWPAEEYHQNYDLKNPEDFEKELRESGRRK